jgi:hypothetical protein
MLCRWAASSSTGEETLVGHVNYSGAQGTFGRIAFVQKRDLVYTVSASGVHEGWVVTNVYARPKSSGVDPAAFLGDSGTRSLALVTCGGAFDSTAHSYVDNVYVFASPANP